MRFMVRDHDSERKVMAISKVGEGCQTAEADGAPAVLALVLHDAHHDQGPASARFAVR
jgi:hypothetical protein